MSRDGVIVPDETSVLCEGCGYTLDGLPTTGQCPECGLPIAASTGADGRILPPWEDTTHSRGTFWRFWRTTLEVVVHPGRFYRTLATRRYDQAALRFARAHWAISAILFAGALSIHAAWFYRYIVPSHFLGGPWFLFMLMAPLIYFLLWGTTQLAARLTAWEAAYRGYRLPLPVVLRSLYYHAAHYLPVSVIAFLTVAANSLAVHSRWMSEGTAVRYLLILSIEVFLAAGYLFKTYWTGMKNTMYANH
jgi:hypothetical protein